MKFSERIGNRPIKIDLEREGLSPELRNSLWTLVLELIIESKSNTALYGATHSERAKLFRDLWINFYKFPIDNLALIYGSVSDTAIKFVRDWFFKSEWDLVFDFIEFTSENEYQIQETFNLFLKREMSAYRFVDGLIVEINSKEEIIEIEEAIRNVNKYNSVKTHLKTAVDLLSNRKIPDYRNSIKESISAVEALSKIITNNEKATLGQALKEIEIKHKIPGSLKTAFSALYGYTSDKGGIRHSLTETDVVIDIEEARFMLVTCSAFVNYLINKI